MMRLRLFLLCTLSAWPAHAITMEELLHSSAEHYPSIAKSLAAVAGQEGKIQSAQGAFDWELNNNSTTRAAGYYDGSYTDSQITRRLSDSATRLYGGYRASAGRFPVYEDEKVTLNDGEFNVGVALSLWRNRIIDEERFAVADARMELEQKKIDLLLTRLGVQYDAMQAYIDWLAAGKAVRVAERMLSLSEKRQSLFATRAEKGDVPRILLTENSQTISKRRAEVNDAHKNLANKAAKLSLYWRDAEGRSLLPKHKDLPKDFPSAKAMNIRIEEEIEKARSVRPELIKVDLGLKREKYKLRLGENKVLPKVDMLVEGAKDIGAGDPRRRDTEAKIGFKISIPLQQNLGRGQIKQSEATITQLEQENRLLSDRIATEIRIAVNNYNAARQNVDLAEQEKKATSAMEQAERERFENGATDFFVLNMREERAAEAELKSIQSRMKLWQALSDYYLATLQTQSFGLKDIQSTETESSE